MACLSRGSPAGKTWVESSRGKRCKGRPALEVSSSNLSDDKSRASHREMFVSRVLRASLGAAHRSTVNDAEIAHFSKLSSKWWDEHGEFGLLHKMNPVRLEFVHQKLLEAAYDDGVIPEDTSSTHNPLHGLQVLDVGCGGGLLSEVDYHFTQLCRTTSNRAAEPRSSGCTDSRHRRVGI